MPRPVSEPRLQGAVARKAPIHAVIALAGLALGDVPVPFSHKRHAALRRPCVECHAGAAKDARAGFPGAAQCRSCHTEETAVTPLMKRVAAWPVGARPFPQTRVYRVKDYVIFGHAGHARAGIGCAECHGDVSKQEPLTKLRDVTMKACVDCHQDRQASLACNLCHELGQ